MNINRESRVVASRLLPTRRKFFRRMASVAAVGGAFAAAPGLCRTIAALPTGRDREGDLPEVIVLPPGFDWKPEGLKIVRYPDKSLFYNIKLPGIKLKRPVEVFVSASGKDTNRGGPRDPLRTLEAARKALHRDGGGDIILDGSTFFGWGEFSTTVPVRITGNRSTIIAPYSRAMRFGADYHISDLIVEGGEVLALGTNIRGVAQGCIFKNSSGSGLSHAGINCDYYVIDCVAYNNKSDGFAFASTANDIHVNAFEANNYAYNNGDSGPENSDQGSTNHTGVRSIRVGCDYIQNNINICDVGNSKNLVIECNGATSRNNTVNLCAGGAGNSSVETWIYGGNFRGGAFYDIAVGVGDVVYTDLDLTGYRVAPFSDIRPLY